MHHFHLGSVISMIHACLLVAPPRKIGGGSNPTPSLEKATSSFSLTSCFTLATTWPQWGCDCWGLAEKSWPQINSAIYCPSPSYCSARDGKYCSLSRITGCRNAPKACFMAGHKCSQGEVARVGLISTPEESRSVTHAPLGNEVMDASGRLREALKGRGGHFALHHASPRHPRGDTRWRATIACGAEGGCQAVTEL